LRFFDFTNFFAPQKPAVTITGRRVILIAPAPRHGAEAGKFVLQLWPRAQLSEHLMAPSLERPRPDGRHVVAKISDRFFFFRAATARP
jgi:hypothetical protein